MRHTRTVLGAAVAALALGLAGCGGGDGDGSGGGSGASTVRLGYFPNLTHATAMVGLDRGTFAAALGDTKLEARTFNAGPATVEALFSGAIDAAYIGPSPTITAYARSRGEAVRVVAGAASGGAALVVTKEVRSAADLKGRKLATPQLGNTQDVALRYWLGEQGLKTTKEGGGDVSIVPQENAQTLDTFTTGAIDGAWVPEPWATRMLQAGGRVLVDERSLWPDGKFVTTHLIVRTKFLQDNPGVVRQLVQGSVAANEIVNSDPAAAQQIVRNSIGKLTGKPLPGEVVAAAWKSMTFTNDPLASSLLTGAEHAKAAGLLDEVDLDGLYELGPVNSVLAQRGAAKVAQP
jgi:NitT/TauT family transport system substrate-binding protein